MGQERLFQIYDVPGIRKGLPPLNRDDIISFLLRPLRSRPIISFIGSPRTKPIRITICLQYFHHVLQHPVEDFVITVLPLFEGQTACQISVVSETNGAG